MTQFIERLLTAPQYITPQHGLSRVVWRLARCKSTVWKNFLIRSFLLRYDVDLSEALRSHAEDYESFNDFFTRELGPGARPVAVDEQALVSPADGTVSQLGLIAGETILQAKGQYYSLYALLGGDRVHSRKFENGNFATIYLAPHNYHRVHAPVGGTITGVTYIPGRLFSVNNRTARCVDKLFVRNERVVVEMQTALGFVTVILIGAMLVSSMELVCADLVATIEKETKPLHPLNVPLKLDVCAVERGAELGRFNMGSTVIVLAQAGRLSWDPVLGSGAPVRVGEAIASTAK